MVWLRIAITTLFIGTVGAAPWPGPAVAQWATKPPAAPPSRDAAPDNMTAPFEDWTLRCDLRSDLVPPQRVCELGQAIQKPGEPGPQAQLAIGRISPGQPLRITVVLPANVALRTSPTLVLEGPKPSATVLSWSRCLAGGCFADAEVPPAVFEVWRARAGSARLDYRDATERAVSQPVSFRGLGAGLDELARQGVR